MSSFQILATSPTLASFIISYIHYCEGWFYKANHLSFDIDRLISFQVRLEFHFDMFSRLEKTETNAIFYHIFGLVHLESVKYKIVFVGANII